MSADSRTTCPRCESRWLTELDDATRTLADLYGKIPADDYVLRLTELRTFAIFEQAYGIGDDGDDGDDARRAGEDGT